MKSHPRFASHHRVLFVCGLFFAAVRLPATTYTWTGNGTTANWSDGSNWSTGTAPVSSTFGTDIVFSASTGFQQAPGTINQAWSVSSITFCSTYSGSASLGTSALTLGSSLNNFKAGANIVVYSNITLAGAVSMGSVTLGNSSTGSYSVATAGYNLTLANVTVNSTTTVSGSGNVIVASSSNATILGALTHTGNTTVQAGATLFVGNSSSTTGGVSASNITVDTGATVKFGRASGSTDYYIKTISGAGTVEKVGAGTLEVSGTISANLTTISAGTLRLSGSGALTGSNVLMAGTLSLEKTSSSYTIPSNFSTGATSAITKLGTGTVTFTGNIGGSSIAGFSTFAGTITVSAGAVSIGDGGTQGAATGSGTTIANNSALIFNRSDSSSFGGTITGTGSVAKQGAGTLTLNGSASGAGTWTLSGGALQLGAANRLASSSPLVLAGGTFATGGFSQTLGTLTLSSASTLDFGTGTSALAFADSSGLTWSGALAVNNYTSGVDTLRFGTTGSALTSTQLGLISFNGVGAQIDAGGYVSPIPEPSTYAALAGAGVLGLGGWRRRRPSGAGSGASGWLNLQS